MSSLLEMSALPLGVTPPPAEAFVTLVIPYSIIAAAIRESHELSRIFDCATVTIAATDGSIIEHVSETVDGQAPRPWIVTRSNVPLDEPRLAHCPICRTPR